MPPTRSKTSTPTDGSANFVFDEPGIKQLISDLQNQISENFKQLSDEIKQYRTDFVDELAKLKCTVATLTSQSDEKDNVIAGLIEHINNLDQYSRNKNIEIENVVQLEGESVEVLVTKIANELNIKLESAEIDAAHRLPSRAEGRAPKIIVQFTTRKKRDLFLEKKTKVLTNTQIIGVASQRGTDRIFVNENLSPYNRELLWKTKTRARELGYRFVWCKKGKIFVKKDETSRAIIKIYTFADIDKIV